MCVPPILYPILVLDIAVDESMPWSCGPFLLVVYMSPVSLLAAFGNEPYQGLATILLSLTFWEPSVT